MVSTKVLQLLGRYENSKLKFRTEKKYSNKEKRITKILLLPKTCNDYEGRTQNVLNCSQRGYTDVFMAQIS